MNGNCLLERPDLNGSDMSLTAPTFPSLMDINQLLAVILPAPLTDGVCDKCSQGNHCLSCSCCAADVALPPQRVVTMTHYRRKRCDKCLHRRHCTRCKGCCKL